MEVFVKKIIEIARKTEPFICKVCNRMVNPNTAKPITWETDTTIIHAWDYGHQHKKVFQVVGRKHYQIEGED